MINIVIKIINHFKGIFLDHKLLIEFSKKDFARKFAGSYFGKTWALLQPFLTMLIYWAVFQFGFKSGKVEDVPFVLWFMSGIIPWFFISDAYSSASNCFIEYGYLVKKVVFNIDILPLVKIFSSLYIHGFFVILVSAVLACFGYYPSLFYLQLIYYMICAIVLVYAMSLITSSIMVFFRDMGQVISITLLIGMWGTPIAWQLNVLPKSWHFFLKLNPLFYIVQGYRESFIYGVPFWKHWLLTIYFWFIIIILLGIGVYVYKRLYKSFADVL
ncbi:teichoic acid transport system permease protein [Anaerosporobacter mobilis DSM 15930]|jgi:teichoic acid transport system permease protein|uniref:Transport permease protein n=1 Tax=Anaerosporobacter mobilis DSM 15930 TaxID=1120996 RepID=A0A1M7LD89_9FIRM|nr:ABC transporter permease [Anaerosporobacter mobilis]SHM75926.1 teichoic acid transport system permease protein [Anaerosporobacter mobilis DSM 15930]